MFFAQNICFPKVGKKKDCDLYVYRCMSKPSLQTKRKPSDLDKAPRLSIRIEIWILLSDICQTQPNHLQIVRRQCCHPWVDCHRWRKLIRILQILERYARITLKPNKSNISNKIPSQMEVAPPYMLLILLTLFSLLTLLTLLTWFSLLTWFTLFTLWYGWNC